MVQFHSYSAPLFFHQLPTSSTDLLIRKFIFAFHELIFLMSMSCQQASPRDGFDCPHFCRCVSANRIKRMCTSLSHTPTHIVTHSSPPINDSRTPSEYVVEVGRARTNFNVPVCLSLQLVLSLCTRWTNPPTTTKRRDETTN